MSAEAAFRSSFQRLKTDCPRILEKGSKISQNNVAREAGLDPSALKKSRFPELINEIQEWLKENPYQNPLLHKRSKDASERKRSLRSRISELTRQRDHAVSLLVDADLKILQLTNENVKLQEIIRGNA